MSGCSTGSRGAHGPLEVSMHAPYPPSVMEHVVAVEVGGVRFERVRECSMRVEFDGILCKCFECSACGKRHDAAKPPSYCPRCGAKVVVAGADWDWVDESRPNVLPDRMWMEVSE